MNSPAPRLPLLLLLLVLPGLLGARGCSSSNKSVAPFPPNAPLRLEAYGDSSKGLHSPEHALALMAHPAHREAVFSLALDGLPAALRFWAQMEAMCLGSGKEVATEHATTWCAVVPQELGCELDLSLLHSVVPGSQAGAERLRQVFLESYAAQWERQRPGFKVKMNLARGSLMLVGAVLAVKSGGAPTSGGSAPAAGGRLQATEVRAAATTAEVRAAATEAAAAQEGAAAAAARSRAVASGAGRAGAGAQRLLAADSVGATRALAPEVLEALEARLLALEAEASALGRQTASLERLADLRPSLSAPPARVPADSPLWRDYVSYWQRRFSEMEAAQRAKRAAPEPPLYWEAYSHLRNRFHEGLEFQRTVTAWLQKDAALLVEDNVGLRPARYEGLTFVDQLVLDKASLAQKVPRVESYSCKMRSFHGWEENQVAAQVAADVREALLRYGGEVQIRRPTHPLFGRTVRVSKVHLVYEAKGVGAMAESIRRAAKKHGVEIHFQ